jgi:23S rRNA U2552 (ribose-2'-O)-methylase RlmE/FtsJ
MGANGVPGASLYGWSEFFPNATIFGADIDSGILFNTDKIKTFYCDQTNVESIRNLWSNFENKFDIIVDDGYHNFSANRIFFENSIDQLKDGGFFIIEDIHQKNINSFREFISKNKEKYQIMELVMLPTEKQNQVDNNLVVIKK